MRALSLLLCVQGSKRLTQHRHCCPTLHRSTCFLPLQWVAELAGVGARYSVDAARRSTVLGTQLHSDVVQRGNNPPTRATHGSLCFADRSVLVGCARTAVTAVGLAIPQLLRARPGLVVQRLAPMAPCRETREANTAGPSQPGRFPDPATSIARGKVVQDYSARARGRHRAGLSTVVQWGGRTVRCGNRHLCQAGLSLPRGPRDDERVGGRLLDQA